jgi:hypothetical protein
VQAHLRRGGDLLLGLFAVVVVTGAVMAVEQGGAPAVVDTALTLESRAPAPPSSPESARRPAARSVVLAGGDLARLTSALGTTGYAVTVVPAGRAEVLAPGALDTVDGPPDVVVLQVLAGSRTTPRTRTAIGAVHTRWPGAQVFVVGPFNPQDRKSTAATRAATVAQQATFLDPVGLHWRTTPVSAVLSPAEVPMVAARLAAAIG